MKRTTILSLLFGAIIIVLGMSFSPAKNTPLEKNEGLEETSIEIIELNNSITNFDSEIDDLAGLDRKMKNFINRWQIKGMSLAITRNDSLVYAKGYGWADKEKKIEMEPGHIMRIASISKLITATGIMVLQEQGKLKLSDKVFGNILKDSSYVNHIADKYTFDITVEHLLRHQAGFSRDPVFSSADVKKQMGLQHNPEFKDFAKLVLRNRLRHKPGEWQRYSNFGYMALSEVIEVISGEKYEDFIKNNVLAPAGCYDMHIGGIYYEDKRENEVRYYTHDGDGKYIAEFTGSGNIVERCYGGNNIPALSGAGAWIGSPIEIARFVSSINGKPELKDIISQESVEEMVEYFDEKTFPLGWNDTKPEKGWTRTGTLSGTTALIRYYPDGECWIMITNTSTYRGPGHAKYGNALFEQCRINYSEFLPQRNLFEAN